MIDIHYLCLNSFVIDKYTTYDRFYLSQMNTYVYNWERYTEIRDIVNDGGLLSNWRFSKIISANHNHRHTPTVTVQAYDPFKTLSKYHKYSNKILS